jgi:hypothetical protein
LPQTKNFYSGVFYPKLKFLLQGLLPILGAPNSNFWGQKSKNFHGLFCPKLFLHLKSFLAGRRFHDGNEVKGAVTTCFASQAASFYDERIQKLVQRYDKYLNNGGKYVEK